MSHGGEERGMEGELYMQINFLIVVCPVTIAFSFTVDISLLHTHKQ